MLIPVRQGLKPCGVFSGLNKLLQEVILSTCGDRAVDQSLMPDGLWIAVDSNIPTKLAIANLTGAINALSEVEKYDLWAMVRVIPSACKLMCDSTCAVPQPPASTVGPLKKLVVHLFECTSKLADVKRACGDTLHSYYARYSKQAPPGNGRVCGVCGTAVLAQHRAGVADEVQWRAAFDHILAEAKFPLLALQPDNLLPICKYCNSDAKLAKNILYDDQMNRRVSFDPWHESASGAIQVGIVLRATGPEVKIDFQSADPVVVKKLKTWNAVYDIRPRVLGEFSSLGLKVYEDLDLSSLANLKNSLVTQQVQKLAGWRTSPYSYWRSLLYKGMEGLTDEALEQVRQVFKEVGDAELADCEATFGDVLP